DVHRMTDDRKRRARPSRTLALRPRVRFHQLAIGSLRHERTQELQNRRRHRSRQRFETVLLVLLREEHLANTGRRKRMRVVHLDERPTPKAPQIVRRNILEMSDYP